MSLQGPGHDTPESLCTLCFSKAGVHRIDAALNLMKCDTCEHTFTVKPKDQFEVYEERYYLEKHANWFANPNTGLFKRVRSKIQRGAPKARRLLDVGYGNGDFLKYMAKSGPPLELCGIDSLEIKFPGINFIQGDFLTYPILGPFDVITCFMVIEHVEDARRFIQKLHETLTPGGLLVISTNNNGGMLYAIARWLKKIGLRVAYDRVYSDHHLQHFTNRSLERILEGAGFQIQELKNHNYPMKAVDTPPAPQLVTQLYLAAVWTIFRFSDLFRNGFIQTFICRKPTG